MTLTTAQQVRLRIQDIPTVSDVTRTFDGSASAFNLEHRNLTSGTAYVPGTDAAWSATGAVFDASGFVTFAAPGSANSAYRVRYVHSVFSDADISHFTAAGGSIPGAALEAVQALMFDGLKRAKWAAPDGTQYDDTRALDALWNIYSAQKEEVADAETFDGGYESWSEEQGVWG
jgi:hypothetical protein